MDPLTAIGLVSNILSFIDFSARLIKSAKEAHDSQHGVLEENRSREAVVRDMQRMSTRMLVSGSPDKADDNSKLSNLTRAETLEKLDSLIQASKLDEAKLNRIESHIAQLRENISSAPSTSEAKPMLMTLLAEEEKVFTSMAQGKILSCLSFEGMDRRSNMVVDTHSNTYEWILKDDSVAEEPSEEHDGDSVVDSQPRGVEDIEKIRAREKLRTWLGSRSSRDVFHLSGKLGSGKSTLMKHIRASPRTEEKLNSWADGRKLTIASFYFWNIGSDYENQCPDFIPQVWPAQWAQANSAPWLVSKTIEVSEKDVIQAFRGVIEAHDVLKSHCFAFFIDGLDEFQATVQDDHRDLVRLLCKWAANPSGNIKLCVSSREYPAFMDGFTPTLRIRFHDLTRRDMDIYIRDKLAHASAEESFENLVSLIMSKANGVFLWVALVVKSLREGLEDGLSCSDLTQEVDILPDQLESLYKHILMSMGKSKRRKAYQTFSMVMELKKHGDYRMSLLAYSFLEEYEAGENFFMNGDNVFPMSKLTGEQGTKRAESSSRRLAGWCKGLVEPYERPLWSTGPTSEGPCMAAWKSWPMELDFVHRSISDFLESDEVQHDMQLNLRRFDHVDAVLNLMVSDVLYENATSVYNTSRSGITNCILLEIMKRYDLVQAPYTYLQRVGELLAVGKTREKLSAKTMSLMVFSWPGDEYRYHSVVDWAEDVSETLETVETNADISSNSGETKEDGTSGANLTPATENMLKLEDTE
ncbi:hypothetical protein INS49_004723 [Diaporthe citri]|uniref:uncharacterized protein n=1 Tax=Diaporthe citri TaxID=83186 RepID=UPI001C827F27|nr:uncharacterized protein INS49_004723 [Diaporthe citri]KAG6354705.1 hypothetical protein INS49_004723 [Diaporthe citri]